MRLLSVWKTPRTTAKGQPSPEPGRKGSHSDRFFRSSHSSQHRISISTAARSGCRPISKRFRVNRQGVVETDLAWIVDQKSRLLHRILRELLQVAPRNADVGERCRYIAIPADRRDGVDEKSCPLADAHSL